MVLLRAGTFGALVLSVNGRGDLLLQLLFV
jgi:hypothetical protein